MYLRMKYYILRFQLFRNAFFPYLGSGFSPPVPYLKIISTISAHGLLKRSCVTGKDRLFYVFDDTLAVSLFKNKYFFNNFYVLHSFYNFKFFLTSAALLMYIFIELTRIPCSNIIYKLSCIPLYTILN